MKLGPHTSVVLLAGGEGRRFAPLSTPEHPKQFLRLFGTRSLLQDTVARFADVIPMDRIWLTTNHRYVTLSHVHLPALPPENILAEPCKKNTAPAIALAAYRLYQRDPKAIMIVLPADHLILQPTPFMDAIAHAEAMAQRDDLLLTLGIKPDRPATEYGYIEQGEPLSARAFLVKRFVEKPPPERAIAYLASGHFYWNSGMFIWSARRLLAEMAQYLPEMYRAVKMAPTPEAFFATAAPVSIDYGLMEHSERVATIPVECGWNDIGSWESVHRLVTEEGLQVNADVTPYLEQYA
ncbi:MAG: mannose-1-phosphate guanylyltransferase [Deltaproteobacteria bacterium]|nr:mannose-1-phosphate guanylyltransferase [Deltaproteobacteria bacterium]